MQETVQLERVEQLELENAELKVALAKNHLREVALRLQEKYSEGGKYELHPSDPGTVRRSLVEPAGE